MNELIEKLNKHGIENKGTDLGAVLQWSSLHIQECGESINQYREIVEKQEAHIVRLEAAIEKARSFILQADSMLNDSLHKEINLSKDYAPHINVMAYHGVEPYTKRVKVQK